MTDAKLLADLQGAEREPALSELARRYSRMVRRAAERVTGDAHLAEDVSQAVFLALVRQAPKLSGDRPLAGWLHHVAVMASRNVLKSEARRRERERRAATTMISAPKESPRELPAGFDAALNRLPRIYRDILLLRFLKGRSVEETAAELGVNEGAVAMRTSRALDRLRRALAGSTAGLTVAMLTGALDAEAKAGAGVGTAVAWGAPGAKVVSLTESIFRTFFWVKVKAAGAVLMTAAIVMTGGWTALRSAETAERVQEQKAARADLAGLQDNTWLKLNPPREPRGRSYSGICMGDGKIWFFGGGHGSYKYNDVEIYDIDANRWDQATDREDWTTVPGADSTGGGADTGLLSPKLLPLAHHLYQRACWVPDRQRFLAVIGPGTWEFDPERKEWECLAGAHAGKAAGKAGPLVPVKYEKCHPSIKNREVPVVYRTRDGREIVPVGPAWEVRYWNPGEWKTVDGKPVTDVGTVSPTASAVSNTLTVYDPVLKKPLCMVEGKTVWAFDYPKMAWERYMACKLGRGGDYYSTYVPGQECHIISAQGGGWVRFNAARKEITPIPGLPKELEDVQNLAYDTVNKVVLSMVPDGVWVFDPATDTFSKTAFGGPRPEARGASLARWATFRYDARRNVFILLRQNVGGLEGGPCESWAYRYRRAP